MGGMKHPLFLNGMLYLPLLLAGTEKVLQRKASAFKAYRWHLPL